MRTSTSSLSIFAKSVLFAYQRDVQFFVTASRNPVGLIFWPISFLSYSQTAIGATVTIQWIDSPEEQTFEEYISYGHYNEDEENDGLGVSDLVIFYYVKDKEELEQLKNTETNREWLVREIIEEHYA